MPLRRRIGLLTALAVGITVLVAGVITYVVVRAELRGQVDDALTAQADLARDVARTPPGFRGPPPSGSTTVPLPPPSVGAPRRSRSSRPTGRVVRLPTSQVEVPVTAGDRAVATGSPAFFSERVAGGTQLRVYTFSPRAGVAVQLARSLNGTNNVLKRLRLVLAAALLLAVAAGGLLGRLFANRALRPVADLTDAVEHVELTGDLSPRIAVDERGRARRGRAPGRALQRDARPPADLTAELDASVESQRRLVADASHELRTPVTSMRTNAEVLRAQPRPSGRPARRDPRRRRRPGGRARAARRRPDRARPRRRAAERRRARGRAPRRARRGGRRRGAPPRAGARDRARGRAVVVEAHRERLGRAVNNLLDNAVKHGPDGGAVEVRVTADGVVTVRDHGPGIAPRRSRARLRPLLARPRGARAPGLRPRPGDRAAGRGEPRRVGHR